jgi:hypothetical protein
MEGLRCSRVLGDGSGVQSPTHPIPAAGFLFLHHARSTTVSTSRTNPIMFAVTRATRADGDHVEYLEWVLLSRSGIYARLRYAGRSSLHTQIQWHRPLLPLIAIMLRRSQCSTEGRRYHTEPAGPQSLEPSMSGLFDDSDSTP